MPETAAAAMPSAAVAAVPTAAAVPVAAAVSTAVTAAMSALGLGGSVRRGHQEAGYADGGETIDTDQSAECEASGQKFTHSALFVPEHFIYLCYAQPHQRK
jgi:hypothetical protein